MKQKPITPLMKQYFAIKEQHPHALLMFQVGDFYELFFDDAKKAAACLAITLTTRGKHLNESIPLCGVPVHALDYYVTKLVKSGFNVALCNQLHEAVPGKVVERGVTQVFTPGTLTDENLLDQKSASYILSFFPTQQAYGLLFGEVLTGQLFATTFTDQSLKLTDSEIGRFLPDEIIVPETADGRQFQNYFAKMGYCSTFSSYNSNAEYLQWLQQQFQQSKLATIAPDSPLQFSFSLLYEYLKKNQQYALEHFKQLHFYKPDDFLQLDLATQKNLELVKNTHDGSRKHTLLEALDGATTAMGSRTVKKWILRPSIVAETVNHRHDVVQLFTKNSASMQKLKVLFSSVGDLERVVGRIGLRRASIQDYRVLVKALETVPKIKRTIQQLSQQKQLPLLHVFLTYFHDFDGLLSLLKSALQLDPSSEWLINKGFDQQLDALRSAIEHGNETILALEKKEQQNTKIGSLKIRYNNIQGYYIEITKPNMHLVPDYYIQGQSLVGKTRFTTQELKTLEHTILTARSDIHTIQKQVYERVKSEVAMFTTSLRKLAQALAHCDALLGFAFIAYDRNYCRPTFNSERTIAIENGRHPVVEHYVGHNFIANDTLLNNEQSLLIITGPNMGGKSTYLRQVALISLMAQCGSFVPADSANCMLLDRIFTRIGAGDNVAEGKSTFLVEMEETAAICTQATKNSLVILDEVGRGTSTFDGLSIAQAVVEYLFTTIGARCLFATHYHELTSLEKEFSGIKSYFAASRKTEQGILLLHKIVQGVADGSFGIDVAKAAQLPDAIVKRAQTIATSLHSNGLPQAISAQKNYQNETGLRKENNQLKDKLSYFSAIDFDNLSPKKAFDILWKFKEDF